MLSGQLLLQRPVYAQCGVRLDLAAGAERFSRAGRLALPTMWDIITLPSEVRKAGAGLCWPPFVHWPSH